MTFYVIYIMIYNLRSGGRRWMGPYPTPGRVRGHDEWRRLSVGRGQSVWGPATPIADPGTVSTQLPVGRGLGVWHPAASRLPGGRGQCVWEPPMGDPYGINTQQPGEDAREERFQHHFQSVVTLLLTGEGLNNCGCVHSTRRLMCWRTGTPLRGGHHHSVRSLITQRVSTKPTAPFYCRRVHCLYIGLKRGRKSL